MAHFQILISACLIGERVRYDGQNKTLSNSIIDNWLENNTLVPLCPEVQGGLTVPRRPAEIQPTNNRKIKVVNLDKLDVTKAFLKGAQDSLELCIRKNIKMAILTEGSPSCGSSLINSGHFDGSKINGEGITTQLLRKNNIQVFSHLQIEQANKYFQQRLNRKYN